MDGPVLLLLFAGADAGWVVLYVGWLTRICCWLHLIVTGGAGVVVTVGEVVYVASQVDKVCCRCHAVAF